MRRAVALRLFGPPSERRAWRSLLDPLPTQPPDVEVFGATDVGRRRRDNQDQFLIAELERGLLVHGSSLAQVDGTTVTDSPQGYLFAVADGVGGSGDGAAASAIAIDAVAHYALTLMPWMVVARSREAEASQRALEQALRGAQARMSRVAERAGLSPDMATTFTLAYVSWPDLFVVHAGDSRCYLLSEGGLDQITRDHTVAQALIAEGMPPEDIAGSALAHTLENALGGHDDDLRVEMHHQQLRPGDQLLLCSDGLTGHVDDIALERALRDETSVEQTVQGLIDAANEQGGRDNVTVVVARF